MQPHCPNCGYELGRIGGFLFYCAGCDEEFDIEETDAAPRINLERAAEQERLQKWNQAAEDWKGAE